MDHFDVWHLSLVRQIYWAAGPDLDGQIPKQVSLQKPSGREGHVVMVHEVESYPLEAGQNLFTEVTAQ